MAEQTDKPNIVGAVHPRYRLPVGHLLTVPAADIVAWGSPAERTQRVRQLQRLRQARARAHFPSFMEYVACDEVSGEPLRMQWFHDEWSEAWDTGRRVLIIAPRAHGKTTVTVLRVIWELGRNPDLRIKIACAADGRAMERLYEISQHITANPRVREVFPGLEPDPAASWSKHAIYVKRAARHRDPSISAHGITSTATGTRADLLLADDVVDRRNALAMPGMRETIKTAWKSDWVNLVENEGKIWYIGTRWTKTDLTADLMANAEYQQLFYAIDPTFGAMWPDRWPEAALRARHREIGSIEFNRGFRNEVTDADTAVFREGWLHFADLATDPSFQAAARAGELHTLTSYDTATAVGDDADYSAGVALAVHPPSRRCYVLDAWHARQTVAQQAAQIFREHQHYRPYRVLIEKAGQAVVDEWLLSEHPELRPVVETVHPTIGKVQRAQAITPLFERGEVIFSAHLNPDAPGWQPGRECLIHELRDFPVAKNDDQIDSLVHGLAAARRYFLDAWAPGVQAGELAVTIGRGGQAEDAYPF